MTHKPTIEDSEKGVQYAHWNTVRDALGAEEADRFLVFLNARMKQSAGDAIQEFTETLRDIEHSYRLEIEALHGLIQGAIKKSQKREVELRSLRAIVGECRSLMSELRGRGLSLGDRGDAVEALMSAIWLSSTLEGSMTKSLAGYEQEMVSDIAAALMEAGK